jgi:hypothetical protein
VVQKLALKAERLANKNMEIRGVPLGFLTRNVMPLAFTHTPTHAATRTHCGRVAFVALPRC